MTSDSVLQNLIGTRYHPVPSSGKSRVSDSGDWAEFRSLWYGRHKDVLDRIINEKFDPKVASKITHVYADLLGWLRRHRCASTLRSADWTFAGPSAVWAESQREPLATAMAVAHIGGMIWLHFVRRMEALRLEVLWGHSVEFEVNPEAPADIQACLSVTIIGEIGKTIYRRSDEGGVDVYSQDQQGKEEHTGKLPIYPIVGLYRDDRDHVTPGLRQTWLTAQRNTELALTDIEHHRFNLPSQRWVVGLEASDLAEMPSGPGTLMPFPPGLGVQCGEWAHPAGMIAQDIDGLETQLRLLAVLEGIPPEAITIRSRAETGAAKEIDAMPQWALLIESWQYCQAWANQIAMELDPLLRLTRLGSFTLTIAKPTRASVLGEPTQETKPETQPTETQEPMAEVEEPQNQASWMRRAWDRVKAAFNG